MRRLLFILWVIGLATMNVSGQKKENRAVPGFTGINASSVFDITVSKGNTETLSIEADNDVMPYVRSEVRGGVLHLFIDNKNNRLRNIKTLKVAIVMKDLESVELSGVSKLTAKDQFSPSTFKVNCSGVSNLNVNINTGQLNINTSGSSKLVLKANVTGDVSIGASGTSKISGELRANNVKLNSSGTSSHELSGSAVDLKITASGTSNVKAGNFTVKTSTVDISGAGKVTVNVSDYLKVNASGASSVNYKGSPTLDVKTSRAANVKAI